MPKKASRLIDKSSVFSNFRSETFTRRSGNKGGQVLLFPSSISDLPLTLYARYESLSTNKEPIKSIECYENSKDDETGADSSVGRVSSNPSRGNRGYGKSKLMKKTASVMCRLRNRSRQTECPTSFAVKTRPLESNMPTLGGASSLPISLNGEATATTTAVTTIAETNIEEQHPLLCFALRNNPTVKGTASDDVINHGKEIKFPVRRIESNAFGHVGCTTFDLSASESFFATNETNQLENVRYEIPSTTHNFGPPSWEGVDHSILSFLTKSRSGYRNETEPRRPSRIKYSWQVVGTSSQTSRTLLESLVKENSFLDDETICNCTVKYSWQIIGIATQTSAKDFTVSGCRSVISFLSAKTNNVRREARATCDAPVSVTVWRNGKKFIVLNDQSTQTFAHKDSQTIFTELYTKYND